MNSVKRVLIVRFSSIGDIIICTPVIRAVKKAYPEAQIHFVTKAAYADLLADNPHIDVLHLLTDSLEELIDEMRNESFDLFIDLHKNLRTGMLRRSLEYKHYLSFQKQNTDKWLMVHLPGFAKPVSHVLDRYFRALKTAGLSYDNEGYELHADKIPDHFNLPENYAVIALGATFKTKQMPYELLTEILAKVEGNCVLLGGKEEENIAKQLAVNIPELVNLCGKTSLKESMSIVKHARVVLCNDTGLMHMACAFQVPVSVVWGSTVPGFGFRPRYAGNQELAANFEVEGLSCRPCSKLGKSSCPKGHFKCMKSQNAADIADSINRWLR